LLPAPFSALTLGLVWVNDYHLMLVPQLVRAKLPTAVIGFFLHVSFPSSEIFRCLSVREYLLRGMLSADLIGFQTANYARHFRQTVSRILALETLPKGIQLDDHFVDVGVFPVGIDVKALKEKRRVIFSF
jgi:trehalose 6-phosphate synthase/phosphatase